jgi:nicotinamidase-related amidase
VPVHPDLIDRDQLVLVVIDIQERLAAAMPDLDRVLARVPQLVQLAGLVDFPVVVTRQYPRGLGGSEQVIVDALDAAETAGVAVTHVDKTAFCACGEPAFLSALESVGREQVVIVGMETHICVVQTALDLVGRGYRVQVVADACCSRDPESHVVALDRMRAAGVVVTVTESVMYEAVGVAATDEFRALLEIVKGG